MHSSYRQAESIWVHYMIKIKALTFCVLLMFSISGLTAERSLLVLGDSLSAAYGIDSQAGWVSLLQQRLVGHNDPWRVINGSISGDTTSGGLSRLPGLLQQHRPELVIIALGSNDGLRGFGFDQIRQNLTQMVEMVEDENGRVVLVGSRLPPNYGAVYAEAFYQLFKQVAQSKRLPLVPFLLDGVAEDRSLMQADGLHPTAEAQTRLLENVWPVLEPLL